MYSRASFSFGPMGGELKTLDLDSPEAAWRIQDEEPLMTEFHWRYDDRQVGFLLTPRKRVIVRGLAVAVSSNRLGDGMFGDELLIYDHNNSKSPQHTGLESSGVVVCKRVLNVIRVPGQDNGFEVRTAAGEIIPFDAHISLTDYAGEAAHDAKILQFPSPVREELLQGTGT